MKSPLWLPCTVLLCGVFAGNVQAQWPRINVKLMAKQVTIHRAVVLPAQVAFETVGFKGTQEKAEEGDRIADILYSAVCHELSQRGVEVLPNPIEAAKADTERYAIADLQARYDTVRVHMRKKPKWVELGKITLDDRVAKFAPGTGSDALVFIRAKGMEPSWKPPGTRSLRPSGSAEVSFVDAKSGEVLAFIRFGILPNVNKTTDRSFPSRLRDALHDVPLPAPPPKK